MTVPTGPDLELMRGDTFDMELVFWADADRTVPYDLSGADTIAAEIRKQTGSPVLATFTVTEVASNRLHLNLPSAQADLLPYGSNRLGWDVQATWPGPVVHTLVIGKAVVVGDITDSEGATPAGVSRA